jgi:hypothetical protein
MEVINKEKPKVDRSTHPIEILAKSYGF